MPDRPDVLRLELGALDLRLGELRTADGVRKLTTKEVALLRYLADREGQDVPREDVLRDVWGYRRSVITRAIDTTLQRLRAKVERAPRQPRHLLTVTGVGYRFEGLAERVAGLAPITAAADLFVGRQAELRQLGGLLGQRRLVTLLGPAGIGKTRLARQAAAELAPVGGSLLVELASARDADAVRRAVDRALGSPSGDAGPDADLDARLGAALALRGELLLVLDNLEQVIDDAAPLVADWLDRAEGLRILATSREALRLGGEAVVELDPLPVEAAVELFVARARARRPGFEPGERATLEALVERLDGLPLAIELAAARVGLMGAKTILTRLRDRFGLLVSRRRDLEPRQRTLRGALDWSWDLLEEDARRGLARCSVFRGGFDLAAAEAVVDLPHALDVLEELREKSLLREVDAGAGDPRFTLLMSIADYAAERLQESGERADAEAQHAAWYLAQADALVAGLDGPEAHGCLARLRRELDNLEAVRAGADPVSAARAALALHAALRGTAPLARMLTLLEEVEGELPPELEARLWLARSRVLLAAGRPHEAGRLASRALEAPIPPELRIDALLARASALRVEGRLEEAEGLFREAVTEADTLGSPARSTAARTWLGLVLFLRREIDEAVATVRRALDEARAHRLPIQELEATRILGRCLARGGRWEESEEALRAALEMSEELGDRRRTALVMQNISMLLEDAPPQIQARFPDAPQRALALARELGDPRLVAQAQRDLAIDALGDGRYEEAGRDFTEVRAIALATGDRVLGGRALSDLGVVLVHQDRLDEAVDAFQRGLALSREADDRLYVALATANLAIASHLRGDLAGSRARYDEVLANPDWLASDRLEAYVRAYRLLLDAEEGRDVAAELEGLRGLLDDPVGEALVVVGEAAVAKAAGTDPAPLLATLGALATDSDVRLAILVVSGLDH